MDRGPGSHFLSSELLRADIIYRKDMRLGLNCVGGESTMAMAGLLGSDAHLVTYGAMAKRPVPIPASFHIFKNLTSHGFWLSRWYKDNGERQIKLVDELARIMASGKVSSPVPCSSRIRSIRSSSSRNRSPRLSPLHKKPAKNGPQV
jgi:NADPH:quinone reductase-like Zn-dependent oxidoreductase